MRLIKKDFPTPAPPVMKIRSGCNPSRLDLHEVEVKCHVAADNDSQPGVSGVSKSLPYYQHDTVRGSGY